MFFANDGDKCQGNYLITPFQADFCVAYDKPFNVEQKHDDDSDDDDSDDDEKAHDFVDCIGHIEKKLNKNGLNYKSRLAKRTSFENLFADYIFNKDKLIKEKRFITIFDRRYKPTHQHQSRKMVSIGPQPDIWLFEPPPNCRDIPKNAVSEWYLNASKTCLLPNMNYGDGKMAENPETDRKENLSTKEQLKLLKKANIGTASHCKGTLLTLSFHVKSIEDIKCYLFWNGQMQRFMPEDITTVLPKIFNMNYDGNEQFMKQYVMEAKKEIIKMKRNLNDAKFNSFHRWFTDDNYDDNDNDEDVDGSNHNDDHKQQWYKPREGWERSIIDSVDDTSDTTPIERTKDLLRYYQHHQSVDDEQHLVKICRTKYKSVIDDYIHIMTHHYNQNLDANDDQIECDIKTCKISKRHHERRDVSKIAKSDPEFIFFQELLDSLHFNVIHLHDPAAGFRVKSKDIFPDDNDDDDNDDEYVDNGFSDIFEKVKKSKGLFDPLKSGRLARFNQINDKLNDYDSNDGVSRELKSEERTFTDRLYAFIGPTASKTNFRTLQRTLIEQEYDTDAIFADIDNDITNCIDKNIYHDAETTNSNIARALYINGASQEEQDDAKGDVNDRNTSYYNIVSYTAKEIATIPRMFFYINLNNKCLYRNLALIINSNSIYHWLCIFLLGILQNINK